MSRRHGTKRVYANVAYQEYISDKNHTHMNATKWETLTNFVKYLGKSGQCLVDETEKGWYIAWVDRDPAALARQAHLDKKRKHEMDDEERARRELRRQVAKAGPASTVEAEAVDLVAEPLEAWAGICACARIEICAHWARRCTRVTLGPALKKKPKA